MLLRNGAKPEDFAEIARINHAHSKKNPYAQFQKEYSLDQILTGPMIQEPLTMTQCCPTSDGGAAAVIVSEAFLQARPHLRSQAILIAGQAFVTDAPSAFDGSAAELVGASLARSAVKEALRQANATIADIKVVELHDCFSAAEMIALDGLGLSEPCKAHELVRNKDITYGGRFVVNPSGGLLSKGHPLGATGLAQCAELVWHLRGWAINRLVPDIDIALAHNAGLGSAGFVTIYKRADGQKNRPVESEEVAKITGLGYNPAVHAKGFSKEQADSVRSKRRSEWALGTTLDKVSAKF
jgi:sterol carrier protein 2